MSVVAAPELLTEGNVFEWIYRHLTFSASAIIFNQREQISDIMHRLGFHAVLGGLHSCIKVKGGRIEMVCLLSKGRRINSEGWKVHLVLSGQQFVSKSFAFKFACLFQSLLQVLSRQNFNKSKMQEQKSSVSKA